ncbi:hypothetical protein ACF3NT_05815 [Naumannella halotolerans]|uniref:hypothetical protein n=1 Tax=Naumannella halotolerans TaxID=993414 RepID=UPI00105BA66E|nr:hypothetical protein [Naumannella halotolerans]
MVEPQRLRRARVMINFPRKMINPGSFSGDLRVGAVIDLAIGGRLRCLGPASTSRRTSASQ